MAVRKEKLVECTEANRKFDTRIEIYNSAEEVVTDCKNRPVRHNQYSLDNREIKQSWFGVKSYEEALDLLKDGYQPVVDEFKGELKVAPKEGARISFSNNIQGFAPVVPLALKCVPNSMLDMRMKPIKAKVIDVYYDMAANCNREPKEFIKAGKAVLGTIIELEKQGYRFNLYAVQSYYGNEDGNRNKIIDFLCIKIKSSDRPLDLKRMSFPLTHPAFFRVIGFDWQARSPITRYIGIGRGSALSGNYSKSTLKELMTEIFGPTACYVSCSGFIDSGYDKNGLKEAFTNVSGNKASRK